MKDLGWAKSTWGTFSTTGMVGPSWSRAGAEQLLHMMGSSERYHATAQGGWALDGFGSSLGLCTHCQICQQQRRARGKGQPDCPRGQAEWQQERVGRQCKRSRAAAAPGTRPSKPRPSAQCPAPPCPLPWCPAPPALLSKHFNARAIPPHGE